MLQLLERRSLEKGDISVLELQLHESRTSIDNFIKGKCLSSALSSAYVCNYR